jgi:hypothetical protein
MRRRTDMKTYARTEKRARRVRVPQRQATLFPRRDAMAAPPGYVSPSYSGSSSEDGSFDELSSAVTMLDDGRGKSNEDAISILDSSDDEESSSVEVVEVVPPDNERTGIKSETKLPETVCFVEIR